MSNIALAMLNDIDKVEPLSDFQREQIMHIMNFVFNEGRFVELSKIPDHE